MRPRTLLILALAVATLGAFVWLVERDLPDTEERQERADRLLDLEAEAVRRVELVFDGTRVVLERDTPPDAEDGEASSASPEWRLVEPIAARADGAEVGSLVRRLSSLDAARTLDAIEDRAAYGLEPPRLEVTLVTADGETRLRVGEELPASSQRLVSLGEAGPYRLVEGGVFETATREPGAWRDRDLFPWSRAEIERVRLAGPELAEPVLLARRGEGFWIEAPFADAADPDRVDRLLMALTGLEADEFLDDPGVTADESAAGPGVEVTVEGRAEPVRIVLGEPDAAPEELADAPSEEAPLQAATEGEEDVRTETVRVGDQRARAETDLRELLAEGADAWRSPRLTGWPVYDIDTIRLREDDTELVLSRDGVDWRRGEDRILYSTVSELLSALTGFRAETVEPRDRGAVGETGGVELVLTHKEGAQQTLRVDREGEEVAVRAEGRDVVLRAPVSAWEPIDGAFAEIREAEPLPAEPAPSETGAAENGE